MRNLKPLSAIFCWFLLSYSLVFFIHSAKEGEGAQRMVKEGKGM